MIARPATKYRRHIADYILPHHVDIEMEQSLRQLGRRRIALMHVHTLIDLSTHLETLRRWRVIGHARYIGATVSRIEDFSALEQVWRC